MRILILGTGAMAKRFGAQLSRSAGEDPLPTLAGTWREAVEAIEAEGIVVEEGPETWTVPARALHRDRLPEASFDLVLVLVKSHQTASVASTAARALAPGGLILSLQNGIGNREILAEAASPARVSAGVTSAGATGLGPNRVRSGGQGVTVLAAPEASGSSAISNPEAQPTIGQLAARLERAGLATEISTDIERLLWRKLAVNCAINPLTALEGKPNGALLDDAALRRRMRAAAGEVEAVARAKGIELGLDAAELAEEVARKTAANRSSMLQDLDRGAPTEIEAICGAVIREGRHLGVPTPVNRAMRRAILDREAAAGAARAGDRSAA